MKRCQYCDDEWPARYISGQSGRVLWHERGFVPDTYECEPCQRQLLISRHPVLTVVLTLYAIGLIEVFYFVAIAKF